MRTGRALFLTGLSIPGVWLLAFTVAEWRKQDYLAAQLAPPLPHVETNAAAQRIAEAAAPLGLELTIRDRKKRQPEGPFSPAVGGSTGELREWLSARLEDPSSEQRIPQDLRELLAENAPQLQELDTAIDGGVPEWAYVAAADGSGPLPNLGSHNAAVRLYVTRALAAADDGLDAEGWVHLGRAWRLTRPLLNRGELISVLVALSETRHIALASIQLDGPSPGWLNDLFEIDPAASVRRALAEESRIAAAASALDQQGTRMQTAAALTLIAREPLLSWRAVSEARVLSAASAALIEGCAEETGSLGEAASLSLPKLAERIERARVQIELARRVASIRSGGASDARRICGSEWLERRVPRGVELALRSDLPHDELGLELRRVTIQVGEVR